MPAHRPAVRAPQAFDAYDPPVRGSLPVAHRPTADAFPPAHGELPIPQPAPPPEPLAQPKQIEPPRRTRVKLTPPRRTEGADDAEDADVRVYEVPPATGLGSFDLGNVPASVTPPRSWRKAAWFATASSGGVVLALMFAGSTFVAKPAPDQAGDAWVPGLGGGVPTLSGEQLAPPEPGGSDTSEPSSTSRDDLPAGAPDEPDPSAGASLRAPAPSTAPPPTSTAPGTSTGASTGSAPTSTSSVPRKPAPSPAPYEPDPPRYADLARPADPEKLASTSQSYLDTVTENPSAASSMTTGELAQEGAEGLERKYADVAYFQVQHVRVHQYDDRTVCTVQTVYKDGRTVTEERTLAFAGDKISDDGA